MSRTLSLSEVTHAWIRPGASTVYSLQHPFTGDSWWGTSANEMEERGCELLPIDEAIGLAEKNARVKYCKPPVRISRAEFWEMLEVLPPNRWVRGCGSESFQMSEATTDSLTGIYAHIGDRYWAFNDAIGMQHDQIVAKCLAAEDVFRCTECREAFMPEEVEARIRYEHCTEQVRIADLKAESAAAESGSLMATAEETVQRGDIESARRAMRESRLADGAARQAGAEEDVALTDLDRLAGSEQWQCGKACRDKARGVTV